jgi:hypothetical protein
MHSVSNNQHDVAVRFSQDRFISNMERAYVGRIGNMEISG